MDSTISTNLKYSKNPQFPEMKAKTAAFRKVGRVGRVGPERNRGRRRSGGQNTSGHYSPRSEQGLVPLTAQTGCERRSFYQFSGVNRFCVKRNRKVTANPCSGHENINRAENIKRPRKRSTRSWPRGTQRHGCRLLTLQQHIINFLFKLNELDQF